MIEPAVGPVETLAVELGIGRRLAARLGALAARGLFVSRAVAAEARPDTLWERLLARRDWLADDPADVLYHLSREPSELADLLRDWPLVLLDRDGHRLLALQDELDAEALESAPPPAPEPASTGTLPALSPRPALSPAYAAAGAGAAEFEALRVGIFAGANLEEKAAALRRLVFLAWPLPEKLPLFLRVLSDPDPALRSVAAQGLRALGLDTDIAVAAQWLADGGATERERAADRLADLALAPTPAAPSAPDAPDGREVIVAALLGAWRRPDASDAEAAAVLDALGRSAPALGRERARRTRAVDFLLEGLLAVNTRRLEALRGAVAALDGLEPGWVAERLADDFARSSSPEYRGRLLSLLSGLPLPAARRQTLMPAAADLLLSVPADSEAGWQAGRFALGCGEAGMVELSDRLERAGVAHQRHLIRLLDNALRSRPEASRATRTRLARAALTLLRSGSRSARIDLLETRLAAGPDLDPDTAADLADALANDLADYADWRLLENIADLLASLGWPAVEPVARVLRERGDAAEAWVLASALGRLGADLGATAENDGPERAAECLRLLQVASFAPRADRDALHVAMGRAASGRALAPELADLVLRTLWRRLDHTPNDRAVLEGLGWVASGPGVSDADRHQLADLLLARWRAAIPDADLRRVCRDDGEEAFEIDADLTRHSLCWIACLEALERLASTETVGTGGTRSALSDLQETIREGLLTGWLEGGGGTAWGPANAARLTAALGRLGAAATDPRTRAKIAHTLARRLGDPATVSAIVRILTALPPAGSETSEDTEALDRLAGALALRMLKTLSENAEMTPEDREFWLSTLGLLGRRRRLSVRGNGEDRIRERLVEALAAGMRAGGSVCRRRLAELREAGVLRGRALARTEEELSRGSALSSPRAKR